MWAGMHYEAHSPEYHQATRRRLCKAVARLLDQEVRDRFIAAQTAAQGLVGIRMKSGVYRGLVMWSTITQDFWDELGESEGLGMGADRSWLLRHLRGQASDCAQWKYGVEVNPATWTHKIYDARVPCQLGNKAPGEGADHGLQPPHPFVNPSGPTDENDEQQGPACRTRRVGWTQRDRTEE